MKKLSVLKNVAMSEGLLVCGIVFFSISFCAYTITIGVGWSLDQEVYPDDGHFRAAAVITTIPVLTLIGYAFTVCYCGNDSQLTRCVGGCAVFVNITAGFFEMIGAILFLVGASGVKDDSTKAYTFGLVAGIFGLIAAVSCCCSAVGCCAGLGASDQSRRSELLE